LKADILSLEYRSGFDLDAHTQQQLQNVITQLTPALYAASAYTIHCAIDAVRDLELRGGMMEKLTAALGYTPSPTALDSCPAPNALRENVTKLWASHVDIVGRITQKPPGRVFTTANTDALPPQTAASDAIIAEYKRRNAPATIGDKVATFVLGGPGTGKGSAVRYAKESDPNGLYINTDDMMELLPGYIADLDAGKSGGVQISLLDAANKWHKCAKDLAGDLLASVVEKGQSFIFDGTGANVEKTNARMNDLARRGYSINVYVTRLDEGTALRRVGDVYDPASRPNRSGRYVPPEVITKHANAVTDEEIIKRYDNDHVNTLYVVNTANEEVTVEKLK